MQVSAHEESTRTRSDYSLLGVICFVIGGFIILSSGAFVVWEILKAPVIIQSLAIFSGILGAIGFGFLGMGVKLITR